MFGMVTGRTNQTEYITAPSFLNKIYRRNSGTGGKTRNIVGIITDLIIRMVNICLTGKDCFFKTKEPVFAVDLSQIVSGGCLRRQKGKQWIANT